VQHSLSPVLHRAAYAALGLAWTYDAIECDEDALPGLLAGAGPEWLGFSCTMPLKRAALALASSTTERAVAVGAANTLLRRSEGWLADNTDVVGIVAAVRERGVVPKRVTVLGAGSTAQAAVAGLPQLGITECAVLVRDPAHASELRVTAQRVGVQLAVAVLSLDAEPLNADLIIATLPRGAADAIASHPWWPGQALLDVIYDPWPTALAASVQQAGGIVVSGALMLLHQAAGQVELMTGQPAPLEAMRHGLRSAAPAVGV
jgi:shikimate dehydrogenase